MHVIRMCCGRSIYKVYVYIYDVTNARVCRGVSTTSDCESHYYHNTISILKVLESCFAIHCCSFGAWSFAFHNTSYTIAQCAEASLHEQWCEMYVIKLLLLLNHYEFIYMCTARIGTTYIIYINICFLSNRKIINLITW